MSSPSSSPFVTAMDAANTPPQQKPHHNQKSLGENQAPEYTIAGVGDPRVALFFALVRNLDDDRLHSLLQDVLNMRDSELEGDLKEKVVGDGIPFEAQAAADAIVMAFQTRHCRGGKGEKKLFYRMILDLSVPFPNTVATLMPLVPHYGSYKDWFQIVAMLTKDETQNSDSTKHTVVNPIVDGIWNLAKDQLLKDKTTLDAAVAAGETPKHLSLLAKWAPREKRSFNAQVKPLAQKLFPTSSTPKKAYRKLVSKLNEALQTTEVLMCSDRWDEIDFAKGVPSVCLMRERKAFLNETLKGPPPQTPEEKEKGNRFPENVKRVACRKRLREELMTKAESKLKGRQLFPHEIAKKFLGYSSKEMSDLEEILMDAQWNDIKKSVCEAMSKLRDSKEETMDETTTTAPSPSSKSIDLGKLVALVDVSGSMSGTPMEVAVALGILVSELSQPAFANRCLTFSSKPDWVRFSPDMTIGEKVKSLSRADWEMNTDFEAAMEQILQTAADAKLQPEDIPDLIVFSDMQFDQARSSRKYYGYDETDDDDDPWETHHERIVRRFHETGTKVCGKPWPTPQITYWNLRGDTDGFPAQADTPGVSMLSGFSPALLKLLLSGEELVTEEVVEEVNETGDVVMVVKQKKNPYVTLRSALDSDDYDKVRKILDASEEGVLARYKVPPAGQEEKMEVASDKDGEWVDVME